MYRLICVVGARPNFMKIAPVIEAIRQEAIDIDVKLVHTGQHYDASMKHQFFEQLGIPEPDIDLGVGSGSHSLQTADIMKRFEPLLCRWQADAILVVGDVNSTIACALVAAKNHVPVIHVEAGLRSHDRSMPEEINRILTDQLSDLLYITEREAKENLAKEGISTDKVRFVGNVMIDTLRTHLEQAASVDETLSGSAAARADLTQGFALLTMHRPSNVDSKEMLASLLETLRQISKRLPVIFPVHPRTASRISEFKLSELIEDSEIYCLQPVGYLQMLGLMANARLVLTDSGGVQEETTALGVPCVTLRENTERPITVDQGTNTIVGADHEKIMAAFTDIMTTGGKAGCVPELWDGKAAVRIAQDLQQWFEGNS